MTSYSVAIKCYKKQLEVAWVLKDIPEEFVAYDLISTCYFYLGNLKKSKYYQKRTLRGHFEPQQSKLRLIFEKQLHNQKEARRERQQT